MRLFIFITVLVLCSFLFKKENKFFEKQNILKNREVVLISNKLFYFQLFEKIKKEFKAKKVVLLKDKVDVFLFKEQHGMKELEFLIRTENPN